VELSDSRMRTASSVVRVGIESRLESNCPRLVSRTGEKVLRENTDLRNRKAISRFFTNRTQYWQISKMLSRAKIRIRWDVFIWICFRLLPRGAGVSKNQQSCRLTSNGCYQTVPPVVQAEARSSRVEQGFPDGRTNSCEHERRLSRL